MDQDVQAIIGDGGGWTYGEPGPPSHDGEADTPHPAHGMEILLPGAAPRITVAAPTHSPWRGVALLNFFKHGNLIRVGSGFLCQPDVLVTAAHNIIASPYDAVGVWMGFDAHLNGQVQPLAIRAWARHATLDIAVFILAAPQPGAFGLGGPLPPPQVGVTLAGYAFAYPDGGVRYSQASGRVTGSANNRLSYAISTREGDSGAPVFVVEGGVPRAVAVHGEAATHPHQGNIGVHLTPPVIADLGQIIAWARTQAGGN